MERVDRRWRRGRAGLTLVDVLLAGLALATGAALLIGGLVAANRSGEARITQALTTELLASRLALLDEALPADAREQGGFPPPLEAYAWTLEGAEETDGALASLVKATLTVKSASAFEVVTYRPLAAD